MAQRAPPPSVSDFATDVLNRPEKLMTKRKFTHLLPLRTMVDVQVRTADRGPLDPDNYVRQRLNTGICHILVSNLFVPLLDDHVHAASSHLIEHVMPEA